MLLTMEKGIEGGIGHFFVDLQNLKTNTRKIMIKLRNRYILSIGM